VTKSDLMRKMHRAGLRLDDAALAAQVAVNAMTAERNLIICRIRSVLSVRQVATILGLSKTHVARLSHDVNSDGTALAPNLHATADG